MISTLEFDFDAVADGAGLCVVAEGESNGLVTLLEARGGWMSAGQILAECGKANTEGNRRQVRKLAELAEERVISGQRGYRHIHWATSEEKAHAANWLESQARKMNRKAAAIRRAIQ